jgi:hypothetical protein
MQRFFPAPAAVELVGWLAFISYSREQGEHRAIGLTGEDLAVPGVLVGRCGGRGGARWGNCGWDPRRTSSTPREIDIDRGPRVRLGQISFHRIWERR